MLHTFSWSLPIEVPYYKQQKFFLPLLSFVCHEEPDYPVLWPCLFWLHVSYQHHGKYNILGLSKSVTMLQGCKTNYSQVWKAFLPILFGEFQISFTDLNMLEVPPGVFFLKTTMKLSNVNTCVTINFLELKIQLQRSDLFFCICWGRGRGGSYTALGLGWKWLMLCPCLFLVKVSQGL